MLKFCRAGNLNPSKKSGFQQGCMMTTSLQRFYNARFSLRFLQRFRTSVSKNTFKFLTQTSIKCQSHPPKDALENISSVIRQKGKSQSGYYKETKYAKFSEKRTFLTLWYAHARLDHLSAWLALPCFSLYWISHEMLYYAEKKLLPCKYPILSHLCHNFFQVFLI